jgi:N-acetylglucosamine-6-phosphate deacetylase
MLKVLSGARIFDGEGFHDDHAIVLNGQRIVDLVARAAIPVAADHLHLKGGILAPGFIDIQVNGGGGAMMNDHPDINVVRQIAQSHRKHGTTGLLPTVITDRPDIIAAAIAAVREARSQHVQGVLGIHVEGPFLDPVRKGAHDRALIRTPTANDIQDLIDADCGTLLLTLAPNIVSPDVISELVSRGVRVSLGHADATASSVQQALAAGATAFTHLYNAMSQLTGREPGMVGAALADKNSFIGIIADGHHVDDASMKLAFAATSHDRFMLITDAMPTAAGGPDEFSLQGRTVTRRGERLQLQDGTLAGSNLTMDVAVRYCVQNLGLPLGTALQMASRNPATFLGRGNDLGRIAPGALASLLHLDENLNVTQTWIEGQ